MGTLHLDFGTFVAWSNILVRDGFKYFYNSWSDYLPGYLYVLWFLGKISTLNIIPQELLFKLPATISDLITGYLIYKIVLKNKNEKWALALSSLYIFNPAVFANSAMWGQVDSLTALAAIFSIYEFSSSIFLSAVGLAIGTLIKPQAAFVFPVIIVLMIKEKWNYKKIIEYITIGLVTFFVGFLPFVTRGGPFQFIFNRLQISASQYPYTSINAFNFWGIFGFWKNDQTTYQILGYVTSILLFVFLSIKTYKQKNSKYLLTTLALLLSFIFFTRIHDRHLLPVFAPLVISIFENPILIVPYIVLSVTYIANLYYSFNWITVNFTQVFPDVVLKAFSLVNVLTLIFILYSSIKKIKINWQKIFSKPVSKKNTLPKLYLTKKNRNLILFGILFFAFMTRVYSLGSPPNEYFDEVYHAFTAKVMMGTDKVKAWEWWNNPPTGFAYEWTHPPVAKLGMVLGMSIFGQNSFGWRIGGAILGVGSVYLVYLLAKGLFDDEAIALMSAGVFSLDGLTLVMSRIGMNDSYLLFFSLLSVYLFMKEKYLFSAMAFGLALSSKWSAIWALPILGIIFLSRKIKFRKEFLWFFVLPPIIYLASYIQMFLTGHNISVWWEMQQQMWWYHTGLKATHPYSSQWWSWPLLIRPIYLYTSDEIGGMVGKIYAMGNPLVFWFGLSSMLLSFAYSFIEKNKKLGIVVFSYLIFFAPWALSPRIMFLYHYLPSIPFLAIATGYVLRRNAKLIIPFFAASLVLFIYFFPHWTGMQVPLWLDQSYYWVNFWR